MDIPLRDAKLAKLLEIEGYDKLEDLLEAVFSRFRLAGHLHERRPLLHL
jgi:hypothetical protein